MEYALIKSGKVQNTIVADADFVASIAQDWDHIEPLFGNAGIGWGWDGSQFVAPTYQDTPSIPTVPQSCSPAQGLVALFAIKQITESDVNAAIAAIADPVDRYTTQIAFARATEWRRESASMQKLALLLSLTEQDLDALFAFAAAVSV